MESMIKKIRTLNKSCGRSEEPIRPFAFSMSSLYSATTSTFTCGGLGYITRSVNRHEIRPEYIRISTPVEKFDEYICP